MIFRVLLIVLASSESLALPSRSFLHHVDFPGKIAEGDSRTVSDGIKTGGLPSTPGSGSTNGTFSSGGSSPSKERLLRSILEQADGSEDADEQSTSPAKCRCPSGECFGEVCKLMDLTESTNATSSSTKDDGAVKTRQIRSSELASTSEASSAGDGVISSTAAADRIDASPISTTSENSELGNATSSAKSSRQDDGAVKTRQVRSISELAPIFEASSAGDGVISSTAAADRIDASPTSTTSENSELSNATSSAKSSRQDDGAVKTRQIRRISELAPEAQVSEASSAGDGVISSTASAARIDASSTSTKSEDAESTNATSFSAKSSPKGNGTVRTRQIRSISEAPSSEVSSAGDGVISSTAAADRINALPTSTTLENSELSNATLSSAKSSPKEDGAVKTRQIRSIYELAPETPISEVSSAGAGVVSSTESAARIDASVSTKSEPPSKESLIHSILEQTDGSEDAEEQSTSPAKCRCPSGECFGEFCKLADLSRAESTTKTSSSSQDDGGVKTRKIRNISELAPEATSAHSSPADADISSTAAAIIGASSTPTPPSTILNIQSLGSSDAEASTTTSTSSAAPASTSTSPITNNTAGSSDFAKSNSTYAVHHDAAASSDFAKSNSTSPCHQASENSSSSKAATKESHIQKIEPHPLRSAQEPNSTELDEPSASKSAPGEERMAVRNETEAARQRRSADFDVDGVSDDAEVTLKTTTLKMAADMPQELTADAVLLERSRRLYARSVDGSGENSTEESSTKVEDLADQVQRHAEVSTIQTSANSTVQNVSHPSAPLKPLSADELPVGVLPDGQLNEDKELTRTKFVRSDREEERKVGSNESAVAPVNLTEASKPAKSAQPAANSANSSTVEAKTVKGDVPTSGTGAPANLTAASKPAKSAQPAADSPLLKRSDNSTTIKPPNSANSSTVEANAVKGDVPTSGTGAPANLTEAFKPAKSGQPATDSPSTDKNTANSSTNSSKIVQTTVKSGVSMAGDLVKMKATTNPTSTKKSQPSGVRSAPEIRHAKFIHPDREPISGRNERKTQRKEEATLNQESRRLGDYEERSNNEDIPGIGGPLDVRTMGGNQLDIDPIDLDDEPKSVRQMEQRSPALKSSCHVHPPAALLSLFLTSTLLLLTSTVKTTLVSPFQE